MTQLSTLKAACAALFCLYLPLTNASTPDGETPAQETVCDGLIGATPGLYGLCVAYCEAQDLDQFGQHKTSNRKLLRVYDKKKTASDPDMPCHNPMPECACWTAAELDAIVNTSGACGPVQNGVGYMSNAGALVVQGITTGMCGLNFTFHGDAGPTVRANALIATDEVDVCRLSLQSACDQVFGTIGDS